MKKLLYILMLTSILYGCEKDTEGVSRTTYYVDIVFEGDEIELVAKGSTYVEPGFVAMEGADDVADKVVVSDNIDETTVGVYSVIYEVENIDGFASSNTRTVIVYDPNAPTSDISGLYNTVVVRTEADGSSPRTRRYELTLTKAAPGVYFVDCLLGNFYSYYFDSPIYQMYGYVNVSSANVITNLSSHVDAWGDGLEDFNDGSFDSVTGGMVWKSVYAASDIFTVTSTKVVE